MSDRDLYSLVVEYLEYKDGGLYWTKRRGQSYPGDRFGSIDGRYRNGGLGGRKYREHQLIFLLFNKYLPKQHIDHIDGDGLNNRIENLRAVSSSQNIMNSKIRKDNKTGVKGVFWITEKKKWRVEVVAQKIKHHIGYFTEFEQAAKAAEDARARIHAEFARHK